MRWVINRRRVDKLRAPAPRLSSQSLLRRNQCRRNAALSISLASIEAGAGPDRNNADTLEAPGAIQPWQAVARRKLTPAHCQIAIESQQAGRRALLHNPAKIGLVALTRPLAIGVADTPVHAPAILARPVVCKQVFQSGPQIEGKRANAELHRRTV